MPTVDFKKRLDCLNDRIRKDIDLRDRDKDLLLDYSRDLKLSGYSDARNYKLVSHMKKAAKACGMSLDEAGREEVKRMVAWVLDRGLSPRRKETIRLRYEYFSAG